MYQQNLKSWSISLFSNFLDIIYFQIVCLGEGQNSGCQEGYCNCDKNMTTSIKSKLDELEYNCPTDPGCPISNVDPT